MALAVTPGCASTAARSQPSAEPPGQTDRVVKTHYRATVRGARTVDYTGVLGLRIMKFVGDEHAAGMSRLLSVGPEAPQAIAGGGMFRVAFDLPEYGGNRRYTIRPWNLRDPAKTSNGSLANVLFQFWPTSDANGPVTRYDVGQKSCSLSIEQLGLKGDLSCPAVADADGHKVALSMSWSPATD
ncbi:MAG: hypothetical protein QOI20_1139 [Acidimicrobiaceae bacterium]|jgi:hypothetical protein|nr:hypothetical protein [Acidimicrobiaceae bacterium]